MLKGPKLGQDAVESDGASQVPEAADKITISIGARYARLSGTTEGHESGPGESLLEGWEGWVMTSLPL